MPRSQGFARGDLDTAFPLDDKFLELRGRVSVERYYEATGIYFHVAAASWREAERKKVSKVCPDAGDVVADLVAVGLLDTDGCVTKRAFSHSVGRAKVHRRSAADRQARMRAQKSRVTTSDTDATDRELSAPRDSVGPVLQESESESPGRAPRTPRQLVHAWLTEHGASPPSGWANTALNELVKVYGADPIVAAWASAPADVKTSRQFVQYAERSLAPSAAAPKSKSNGSHGAEEAERAFSRR